MLVNGAARPGESASAPPLLRFCSTNQRAAYMQEAIQPIILSEAADPLAADAYRAEAWAGEPFLRDGEDPAEVLAPGTARRRALDDALTEIEADRRFPSSAWKVRYGLMLGLERVLADPAPHTAAGTPLRRHQIDALAGMLTELIAAPQRDEEFTGSGRGRAALAVGELKADRAEEGAGGPSTPAVEAGAEPLPDELSLEE